MVDLVFEMLFWILCACLSSILGGILFKIYMKFQGY